MRRYARHLSLPEVGVAGQEKLKSASVLCVGAGGLGSPVALYLAAAGVGRIGIVDDDAVDFSNLQRQILHGTPDVGQRKTNSARQTLTEINPDVVIETHDTRLTSQNGVALLSGYDIIVDGTDNFPTRYLINDACVLLNKPNVFGSIFRFEAQVTVFWASRGPCYRCLFPTPPPPGTVPSCAEGGVLGVLPGVTGCLQATEAIKLILQIGEPLIGRLLLFDALGMNFRELKLRRNVSCPVCGKNPTITGLIDYEDFCGMRVSAQTESNHEVMEEITAPNLAAKLKNGEPFTLLDVREPYEYAIAQIPGSVLIPLGSLAARLNEFDPNDEFVVHCKSGARSSQAVALMQQAGFKSVKNLKGGILAWSETVDASVPTY